ncbi:hypothetical protein JW960_20005 [candidate division KSB1 bacterium]|nr:hypothetical protein [candidate division KSB1 bacterium]
MNKRFVVTLVAVTLSCAFSSAIAQKETSVLLPGNAANYNINTSDINSIHTRTKLFKFTNHLVSDVAYIVQNSLSKYGSITIDEPNNLLIITDEATKLEDVMSLCAAIENNVSAMFKRIDTKQVFVKHNRASDLINYLEASLSVDGYLKANNDFNFIVINDHPNKIKEIEQLIAEFDVPQKQILIDVEVIEFSTDGLQDAGVNWDEMMRGGWIAATVNTAKNNDMNRQTSYSGQLGIHLPEFRHLVRLMTSEGKAKIVSTPQIVTRNNQTGSIWYGKDIRYPNSIRTESPRSSQTIEFLARDYKSSYYPEDENNQYEQRLTTRSNTTSPTTSSASSASYGQRFSATSGLLLQITPTIGMSDLVKLNIHCEASDIVNWTTDGIPIVSGQQLESQLIVAQDQTYFLGGLNKQVTITNKRKVPLLGTILPFLFSREVQETQEVKLAILLTPHIITADELAKASRPYNDTTSDQPNEE